MATGKSLDSFLKQIHKNSSFIPKVYENENNNDKEPPATMTTNRRKRVERGDNEVLNLDKDDDIQFIAEFLDDEVEPDVELELEAINEKYAPKVKRPRRALDFEDDLLLDLANINRAQREAAAGATGSSTAPDADDPEELEIVVRHRQVLRLIPTVPHVPIACDDGSRVYLRLAPDPDKIVVDTNPNILEQIRRLNPQEERGQERRRGLLGISLDELRRRFDEEQKKFNTIMGDLILSDAGAESRAVTAAATIKKDEDILWVEKYKPRSYMDLLSEETINHALLHWLKLWDNAVFGTDYIAKVRQTKEKYASLEAKEADRWKRVIVEDDAYDELGRPKQKVVLLHGPPGLGKTTAAHIICAQAGYNVIELNASDDRSVDIFKKALDSATQSRSEMLQDGRPTCLIIDEIDGAPLPSVQVLVDLIAGKATEAGKSKAKKQKVLRRPIICICNELHAPALKNLKKLALLVPFQPISVSALVERLEDISLKENLPIDQTTMYALAEKTDCDVRSCLSCIQFMKGKAGTAEEREKMLDQLGIQDKTKGIFEIWRELFLMPECKSKASYYGKKQVDPTRVDARFDNILRVTQSYGEYERLFEGVFENYLKSNFHDSYMNKILMGLEWIDWFDQIQSFIQHQQNYSLMGLLPYYFVAAHFLYAGKALFKLQFPTNESSATAKRFLSTTKSQILDMEPNIARFVDVPALTLDIFPALVSIVQPSTIRPVPTQLWSPKERETLQVVVDTMLAYNLTYTQERSSEGNYVFAMDPDIEALTTFKFEDGSNGKTGRRQFAYAVKQLIAREIETEKLRRGDSSGGTGGERMEVDEDRAKPKPGSSKRAPNSSSPALKPESQSSSSQSEPMSIESQDLTVTKERKAKPFNLSDYFNVKIIPKKVQGEDDDAKNSGGAGGSNGKDDSKGQMSDIYYRYKSGYTNAVRRYVRMKDLL